MAARFVRSWRYVSSLAAELTLVFGALALVWFSHIAIGAPHSGAGHLRHFAQLAGGRLLLANYQRIEPAPRPEALTSPALAVPPEPPAQTFEDLTPQQAAQINAAIPFSRLPNLPARPFRLPSSSANDRARALTCLTMAVYYEAASESDEGQAAVAQVVLNRVRHPLFPKTVCGVVFQGSTLPTGCQFTFSCDGSLARRPSQAGWLRAQTIAQRALDGYVLKQVGEATHYHTQYVVPYWQPTLVKLTQIGAHLFYRWMGGSGLPAAFNGQYAGYEPPPPPIPGFDQGPTTVMVARNDAGPQLAEITRIDDGAAKGEAAVEAAAVDAAPPPVVPSPAAAETAPGPKAPVYFGKPFQRGHRPAPASGA